MVDETAIIYNSPRVFVHFRVHEPTGLSEPFLYRPYRVHSLIGKPRKRGRYRLRHSHLLYRHFVSLTGAATRPDRVSLKSLEGAMIRASVRTVTIDWRQRSLPEALYYSVIDELLAVEAGALEASRHPH